MERFPNGEDPYPLIVGVWGHQLLYLFLQVFVYLFIYFYFISVCSILHSFRLAVQQNCRSSGGLFLFNTKAVRLSMVGSKIWSRFLRYCQGRLFIVTKWTMLSTDLPLIQYLNLLQLVKVNRLWKISSRHSGRYLLVNLGWNSVMTRVHEDNAWSVELYLGLQQYPNLCIGLQQSLDRTIQFVYILFTCSCCLRVVLHRNCLLDRSLRIIWVVFKPQRS